MKCRSCGHEIPANVRYCDNCGQPVVIKNKKSKKPSRWSMLPQEKRTAILIGVPCIVFCLIVVFHYATILRGINEKYSDNFEENKEEEIASQISELEMRVPGNRYQELKEGMTYDSVTELFGGDGLIIEKTKDEEKYAWPGNYLDEIVEGFGYDRTKTPIIYVYVDTDKKTVTRFEETNVVDGAEMNKLMERDVKIDLDEEQLKSIEKGTSYEETVKILGNEGRLIESKSGSDKPRRKTYQWEYPTEHGFDEVYKYWRMTFEDDAYI